MIGVDIIGKAKSLMSFTVEKDVLYTLRDFGQKDTKNKAAIIKKYHLSPEDAESYLQSV